MGTWGYSIDGGENYHGSFDTREAAIEEGFGCTDCCFLVAQGTRPAPSDFVPGADDVIDIMQERAFDSEGGQWSEDWLCDLPDDAMKELDTFLGQWAEKHCAVTWYLVEGEGELISEETPRVVESGGGK